MSDAGIRSLQRETQQNSNDVQQLWSYIRALERSQGAADDAEIIQQFLTGMDYKSQQITWEEILRDFCVPISRKDEAIPFWVVTGSFVRPSIIHARVLFYPATTDGTFEMHAHHAVWGYQKESEHFGSYGADPDKFLQKHLENENYFFKTKIAAIAFLQQHVAHPGWEKS